jgi:hypothetical protein
MPYADPDKRRELNRQWMIAWRAAKPERARAALQRWRQCASFDLTQHDQVLLCFHYSNLRPLWRPDNNRRPRKE